MIRFAAWRLASSLTVTASSNQSRRSIVSLTSSSPKSVIVSLQVPKEIMKKKSFYAVVRGRVPGIYFSWDDCAAQVLNYKDNLYKGFKSEHEAIDYMEQQGAFDEAYDTVSEDLSSDSHEREHHHHIDDIFPPYQPKKKQRRMLPADIDTYSTSVFTSTTTNNENTKKINVNRHQEKQMPPIERIRIEFDGASKRNPGPSGFGSVVYDDTTNKELRRIYHYMGDNFTNNQAEYAGLIIGLQAALDLGTRNVVVRGDSMLVIMQVQGLWQIKNEGLKPYHRLACRLKDAFGSFHAKQVPRAENKVADELSNLAISDWNGGKLMEKWDMARVHTWLDEFCRNNNNNNNRE